ncbi:Arb2 domain-containing protein [Xylariaceae sp. AK1471]|nr:Arb2 domain-containing protein [Xylariaceae sp. AK1471]
MFVRKWSALPADPEFPSDLKGLGYFINKDDEVRSIENEDNYFKFFINRNERWNDRQRFAMNQAIQEEIHIRLQDLGLKKLFLPISSELSQPQVPIFISADIASKSRVVLIFGETHQDLGVLAHRVLGGKGGIKAGSLITAVNTLQAQQSSPGDPSPPGIILANMGELLWWPDGKRTLSAWAFDWAPMRSAAHIGNHIDPKVNHIPGNEDPKAHVKYIFEKVVPDFVKKDAGLDIIGLGDGADVVTSYLNCDEVWKRVGGRINCFASVGCTFPAWDVKCDGLRAFLKDRTRAYVPSSEPLGLILSGPSGNPHTSTFTSLGCPVFSAGEQKHVETLFVASYTAVLGWLQEVALTPSYKNAEFAVFYQDETGESSYWDDWKEEGKGKGEGVTKHRVVEEVGEGGDDADAKEMEKGEDEQAEKDRTKHVVRVDSLSDSEDEDQEGSKA